MCDCYTPQGEPIPTNKRYNAAKVFSHPDVAAEVPWYEYWPNFRQCFFSAYKNQHFVVLVSHENVTVLTKIDKRCYYSQ